MIHLHPPFHLSQKPFHSLDLGRPVLNKTLFKITHLYLYFFLIYPKISVPATEVNFKEMVMRFLKVLAAITSIRYKEGCYESLIGLWMSAIERFDCICIVSGK